MQHLTPPPSPTTHTHTSLENLLSPNPLLVSMAHPCSNIYYYIR